MRTVAGTVLLAVLTAVAGHARADVIDVPAAQDATLYGGAGNVDNSGSGPGMFVGTDAMRLPKRGLVSFDVADYVPAGATVTSVSLTLHLGQIAGSGGGASGGPGATQETIRLYEVTTPWRGGVNGTTGHPGPGFGGTGHGFTVNPGDVTWSQASYGVSPWKTPGGGGDFAATESADTSVGAVNGPYTWSSTPALVADVQGWLDGATPNDGLLLKNDDETGQFSYRAFYTREGAIEQGVPGFAPELAVGFTLAPEPTGWTFGLAALCGLGALRARRL